MRIAFVAEGDAETKDCWSGCAQGFVEAMRRHGVHVDVVNAALRGWRRWMTAATSWHPNDHRWRQRYTLGDAAAARKATVASAALRNVRDRPGVRYDAVVQAGATFNLSPAVTRGAIRVVYADANIRFASRGRPYSGVRSLEEPAIERIARREQRIYDSADRIWAWSAILRDSFIDDFAQPADRVATLFAGANVTPNAEVPRRRDATSPPTVLFVGRDHVRKGSAVLLEAFGAVRAAMPRAELHFVGAIPAGATAPGVTAHGAIDTRTVEGRARLSALYERATVFCLPSRYEPFGVVFLEAMLSALPCIGTGAWAMPEIISDGETGWLARPGDPHDLAGLLIRTLADRATADVMGQRGRQRALDLFTWDRVAERAIADLESFRATRAPARDEAIA